MSGVRPIPVGPPAAEGSLAEALAAVPEPRRPYGWNPRYEPLPVVALLQLTVVATLCGARGQWAVAQWGRERLADDPGLLETLGLPPGRSPCVATLQRVFKALDGDAFERAVGRWLATTGVAAGDAVAVDGTLLRGSERETVPRTYLVAAYAHAAGAVLAQVRPAGKGHELAAAKQVLAEVPLVTADALLTQRELCEQVVQAGGDSLLPVDANQPALRADLEAAVSPLGRGEPTGAGGADAPAVAAARPRRARRAVQRVPSRRAEGEARPA